MANTYSWKINALDVKTSVGEVSNVVYSIKWQLNAIDSSELYNLNTTGDFQVEYNADNFIPYESLTKEVVVSWLEAGLDIDNLKLNLDKQIEKLITPVNVTYTDPFASGV